MSNKRRLKRQLGLPQAMMLATAGTIAAEIFVLTGHAASRAGPATVVAIILAGLLSYSIALNYCELATAFPVTGGAMTYVREAWGTGLLSFLVGSFDCLSSTFYAGLSAVGFAYSLRLLLPGLPLVPTALAAVVAFIAMNLLGVGLVGRIQVLLGGLLLSLLGVYVIAGLVSPNGFSWQTFSAGGILTQSTPFGNIAAIVTTIALVYNAYVGFEVIADDAEEIQNPSRNIPLTILLSLALITVIYALVTTVALGTKPWQEIAGSETALSDTIALFLPRWGVSLISIAGIVATLTSINSAMLSATREALTLSRDGLWPRFMSKLSPWRTPYWAVLAVGGCVLVVAAIGVVDFLSYISSAGYLFVLFFSNLAMIRLRQRYPDMPRPFKVPFFPLTAYLAAGTALFIIAFSDWRALLALGGLLATLSTFYYLNKPMGRLIGARAKSLEARKNRILVAAMNPATAQKLVDLATIISRASEDSAITLLSIVPFGREHPRDRADRLVVRLRPRQRQMLARIIEEAREADVPLYTQLHAAPDVSQGILDEVRDNVKLVLMGWPGRLDLQKLAEHHLRKVLDRAPAHVAVLSGPGVKGVKRILVPMGGGAHSRLALRLAYEIAERQDAQLTVLHCYRDCDDTEELEDKMLALREMIEDELGRAPAGVVARVARAGCLHDGLLCESQRQAYDLIVIGASASTSPGNLFGAVDDELAEELPVSVLLVRRYEHAAMSWIRQRTKQAIEAVAAPEL